MDKKKIVIVVLVILAVLFFSGVAGNLVPKKQEGANKDTYKGGGWETTLGEWMAPFTSSLNVKKLLRNSTDCKSRTYQNKHKVILLSKTNNTCVIHIPKLKDEKYSKGKLSLVLVGSEVPNVTVQYVPDGKSEKDDDYKPISFKPDKANKPVKAFSFVVLEKGGKLIVKCEGCFAKQDQIIRVKFE